MAKPFVFRNDDLNGLALDLPSVLWEARAPSTNKAYGNALDRWKQWTKNYSEVSALPANPKHIVLYMLFLARSASTVSVINLALCSIAWSHKLAGLPSPTEDILVVETLNGLKRKLAKPALQKEPFSLNDIEKIINCVDNYSLKDFRNSTIIILGFYAFLRVNEVRNLKGSNIVVHSAHLEINVVQSKCDQLRQGSTVVVAKLGGVNCPVGFFLRYLSKANIILEDNKFLFRRLCAYKDGFQLAKTDVAISYNQIREAVKAKASQIGLDERNYSTHSMRAGGRNSRG